MSAQHGAIFNKLRARELSWLRFQPTKAEMTATTSQQRETDYLIIGAGAMGIAFADEIFSRRPQMKLTLLTML